MRKPCDPDDSPSPCRQAGRSLVDCPDCGREVSQQAGTCVHCGRPWPGGRGELRTAMWILVAVVALAAVVGVSVQRAAAPPSAVASGSSWDEALRHRPTGCGFLGVMLHDQPRDAVISFVAPDSPAQQSGLRAGDRILRVDGRTIATFRDYLQRIWATRPGDRITLTLARASTAWTIDIVLGRHPND